MLVYLEKQAQIKAKVQAKALIFDKAPTKIQLEYFNYNNVLLVKNVVELLKYFEINNYAIKLKKDKHPLFGLIYN